MPVRAEKNIVATNKVLGTGCNLMSRKGFVRTEAS